MHWIKEHPYLTGTLVLLVLLYFIFRSRSSGAASTVVQSGPSDSTQAMAIQANAALQGYQASLNANIANDNAAVNIKALETAADVQKTQLAANVYTQDIISNQESTDFLTWAKLQFGLASLGQTPVLPGASPSSAPQPQIVGVGTIMTQNAVQATAENAAMVSATPAAQAAGAVPSPADVALNPTYYSGYASGQGVQLPSADNLTYDQLRAAASPSLVNPAPGGFVNNGNVGYNNAVIDALNYAYINDPNSCHNKVCA